MKRIVTLLAILVLVFIVHSCDNQNVNGTRTFTYELYLPDGYLDTFGIPQITYVNEFGTYNIENLILDNSNRWTKTISLKDLPGLVGISQQSEIILTPSSTPVSVSVLRGNELIAENLVTPVEASGLYFVYNLGAFKYVE